MKVVLSQLARLRGLGGRYRATLLVAGLTVFAGGVAWSLAALELDPQRLRYSWLVAIALAVAVAVVVNALEQWFAGRALALRYPFGEALTTSCAATIANVLPLPGGLLVRGASLAAGGASARDSAAVLGAGAAIWVLLAGALVTAAAVEVGAVALVAALLLAGALTLTAWLARRFDPVSALVLLATRAVLLALTVARLGAILALIGAQASWREAAVYSGASLVGQVVGVIPAGIGLVEAVGAWLALAIDAAPEAAFLALSLNRLFGLAAAGIVLVPGLLSGLSNRSRADQAPFTEKER